MENGSVASPAVERNPAAGDPEVAARFRYFLEQAGLSREQFVEAVDGAITARSLYAILSGARRPSKALAVLIERSWGFRAEFLLAGAGEMWSAASRAERDLSPDERDVLAFMRRSVENAAVVRAEVKRAELWEGLFARTLRLMGELASAADDDDYPLFTRLALEECLFLADRYEQLAELRHDQLVHELTDEFVRRFVERLLSDGEREQLAPVRARRRRAKAARHDAICELERALAQIAASGLPHRELLERAAARVALAHRAAIESLRGTVPDAAVDALIATAPPAATRADGLAALVDELATSLEPKPVRARHTAEELEQLHRRIIERLAA